MIYVRDFGGTIIGCKDYKINTKKHVKLLFFSCHAAKFSSLSTYVLLSYIQTLN